MATNQASEVAQQLLLAARTLGQAIDTVNEMEKWVAGRDTIKAEMENADRVVIEGPEIVKALGELAMRLDRAAWVRRPWGGDSDQRGATGEGR